jgi:hypothetical protein
VWDAFATHEPGADFTRIYPFTCKQPFGVQEDR